MKFVCAQEENCRQASIEISSDQNGLAARQNDGTVSRYLSYSGRTSSKGRSEDKFLMTTDVWKIEYRGVSGRIRKRPDIYIVVLILELVIII